MSEHRPCPTCGAPVKSERNYGRYGAQQFVVVWTCGASSNYDGPGEPCRNADERAKRDEATQPGQDDHTTNEHDADNMPTESTTEIEIAETLPAVLTSAQVTERELRLRMRSLASQIRHELSTLRAAMS